MNKLNRKPAQRNYHNNDDNYYKGQEDKLKKGYGLLIFENLKKFGLSKSKENHWNIDTKNIDSWYFKTWNIIRTFYL